jgi:hypothetical protein
VAVQRSLASTAEPISFITILFSACQYVSTIILASLVFILLFISRSIFVDKSRVTREPICKSTDTTNTVQVTSTNQETLSSPQSSPTSVSFSSESIDNSIQNNRSSVAKNLLRTQHGSNNNSKQPIHHVRLTDYVTATEQIKLDKIVKRSICDRGSILKNVKRVFFRSTHGHMRPIMVDLNGTVISLFQQIERLDGIPSGLFRIKCNGVDLYHGHNRTLLSDYHLQEDMDLHAVFRGRGGGDANDGNKSNADRGNYNLRTMLTKHIYFYFLNLTLF